MRSFVLLCLFVVGCTPIRAATRTGDFGDQQPGVMRMSPLTVFQSSQGPLNYQSPTLKKAKVVPKIRVTGEACQSGLNLPVGAIVSAIRTGNQALAFGNVSAAWGDGGYQRAIAEAASKAPGHDLVDVRADLEVTVILGIWMQQCVNVNAGVL
jgi:hypothetical protein